MSVGKEMQAALATYLKSVEQTLTELGELEQVSQTFSTILQSNDELETQIEDAQREIGHLYGQRIELYNDFHNASFEGLTERIEEIQHQKNEIDRRISELEDGIEIAREKVVEVDSDAIAEMLQRVDNAEVPVPFGPRIVGTKLPRSNGSWEHKAPSGLLAELQAGNDQLIGEINAVKARIKGMEDWSKYTSPEPQTPAEKKLREALATR